MHNAIVSVIWGVPILLLAVYVAHTYEAKNGGRDLVIGAMNAFQK